MLTFAVAGCGNAVSPAALEPIALDGLSVSAPAGDGLQRVDPATSGVAPPAGMTLRHGVAPTDGTTRLPTFTVFEGTAGTASSGDALAKHHAAVLEGFGRTPGVSGQQQPRRIDVPGASSALHDHLEVTTGSITLAIELVMLATPDGSLYDIRWVQDASHVDEERIADMIGTLAVDS